MLFHLVFLVEPLVAVAVELVLVITTQMVVLVVVAMVDGH